MTPYRDRGFGSRNAFLVRFFAFVWYMSIWPFDLSNIRELRLSTESSLYCITKAGHPVFLPRKFFSKSTQDKLRVQIFVFPGSLPSLAASNALHGLARAHRPSEAQTARLRCAPSGACYTIGTAAAYSTTYIPAAGVLDADKKWWTTTSVRGCNRQRHLLHGCGTPLGPGCLASDWYVLDL